MRTSRENVRVQAKLTGPHAGRTTSMLAIIIQLIAGAIGGNAAGAVLKNQSLGGLGNTIAGVVGGGLGGKFWQ